MAGGPHPGIAEVQPPSVATHRGHQPGKVGGGEVAPGDTLTLVARPHPDWALARLLHHWYVDRLNRPALAAIAALEALSPSWRQLAGQRLESGRVEDWSRRLFAPGAPEARTPQT